MAKPTATDLATYKLALKTAIETAPAALDASVLQRISVPQSMESEDYWLPPKPS